MSVGVWLLVVGLCDLLRAATDATSARRRGLLAALGVALLGCAGLAAGFDAQRFATVGVLWVVGLVVWVLASSLALNPESPHHRARRAVAFAGFGVTATLLTLVGGAVTWPGLHGRMADTLVGTLGVDTFVLVCGVALFQLSTANLLVRLLLDAIGVPAASNEDDLKGGRLLGPMERLVILVLAVAGELTAVAVVVAAKGLLRFPELQRSRTAEGPTTVSEYFLIGSFASWLLALGGWLLIRYG